MKVAGKFVFVGAFDRIISSEIIIKVRKRKEGDTRTTIKVYVFNINTFDRILTGKSTAMIHVDELLLPS